MALEEWQRRKVYSCKVGTVPALVVFRHKYKPRVGLRMYVRYATRGSKFFRVTVTGVNDDGYFFCDL